MLDRDPENRIDIDQIQKDDYFYDEKEFEENRKNIEKENQLKNDLTNKYKFRIKSLKNKRVVEGEGKRQSIFSSELFSLGTGIKLQKTKNNINRLSINYVKRKSDMSSINENLNILAITGRIADKPSILNIAGSENKKSEYKKKKSFFFQYK